MHTDPPEIEPAAPPMDCLAPGSLTDQQPMSSRKKSEQSFLLASRATTVWLLRRPNADAPPTDATDREEWVAVLCDQCLDASAHELRRYESFSGALAGLTQAAAECIKKDIPKFDWLRHEDDDAMNAARANYAGRVQARDEDRWRAERALMKQIALRYAAAELRTGYAAYDCGLDYAPAVLEKAVSMGLLRNVNQPGRAPTETG